MSEDKQLLKYYQGKIDQLYNERLSWLSKFNESNTHLEDKQKLMNQLKDHKDKEADIYRNIIHHDIALIDEKVNVTKMERENIYNEYSDALEILKIEELMEEYPQQIEKHLPCKTFLNNGEIIQNELNIHSGNNLNLKKPSKANLNIFRDGNCVLNNAKYSGSKVKYRPSYQQLMRQQMNEVKTNQEKEKVLLEEQQRKLKSIIQNVKNHEDEILKKERSIVQNLRADFKKSDKVHKQIANKYFEARREIKEEHLSTVQENQKLKNTLKVLESKVQEEMQIYEKENKAKQTLIIRKSEDFQEDYKARMRAKERNLQALKDNYEKMQEVCIQKIQKLEETLGYAKSKLKETERRKDYLVSELRASLNDLQKQVKEEKYEKAKVDLQIKQKLEQDKRKRQQLHLKEQEEKNHFNRNHQIEEAYKKTMKPVKNAKSKSKQKNLDMKKSSKKHPLNQQSDESMNMSDLQNIRQNINKLQSKIKVQNKKK